MISTIASTGRGRRPSRRPRAGRAGTRSPSRSRRARTSPASTARGRRASSTSRANSGASTMTQNGSIEFGQLGRDLPAEQVPVQSCRRRRASTTVNCCWNSDQNTTLPSHIGMNARTRLRSSPSPWRLVSMQSRRSRSAISTTTIATAVERFVRGQARPTRTARPRRTTTATTPAAGRSHAPAGSGSGDDRRRSSGRSATPEWRRSRAPIAMPIAARPNAQWKPQRPAREPGEQRADEGADVDAHVEDRESGVGARVVAARTASRRPSSPRSSPRRCRAPTSTSPTATPRTPQDRASATCADHHRASPRRTACARHRAAGRPPRPRRTPRGTRARRRRR